MYWSPRLAFALDVVLSSPHARKMRVYQDAGWLHFLNALNAYGNTLLWLAVIGASIVLFLWVRLKNKKWLLAVAIFFEVFILTLLFINNFFFILE